MLRFNQAGLTLPEILIVMLIIGSSLSIVAPLTVDAVERRQQRLELVELKSNFSLLQNQATWANQELTIKFEGLRYQVVQEGGKPFSVNKVEYTAFAEQEINIMPSGLASRCAIKLKNGEAFQAFDKLCLK